MGGGGGEGGEVVVAGVTGGLAVTLKDITIQLDSDHNIPTVGIFMYTFRFYNDLGCNVTAVYMVSN